jgi:hypothetical protein
MAICWLYLLVPFAFLSAGYVWQGHQAALMMLAPVLMVTTIRDRLVKYLVWYVTAWAIVLRVGYVIGEISVQLATRAFLSQMLLTGAVAVYVACAKSRVPLQRFYDFVCIVAIAQAVIAIGQLFGFDVFAISDVFHSERSSFRTVGTLGNSNFLGAFLAMSLPFFFRGRWKLAGILPLVAMCLSQSTGAVVSFAAAMCVQFAFWRAVPYAAGFLMIYIAIDWSVISATSRIEWALATIGKIFEYPLGMLFGRGPVADTGMRHPIHNDWIEMWLRYGLVSLSLALTYIINLRGRNRTLVASLAAFFVNALVSYPFRLAPMIFLAAMCMGLLERDKSYG